MATHQTSTAPVQIERYGKACVGSYTVVGTTVTVTYHGTVKSAEAGEMPPQTVARELLRMLVDDEHKLGRRK